MNVVGIFGSPRQEGNSTILAQRFLEYGRQKGANVQAFLLNLLHVKGCQGCGLCKNGVDDCVISDDAEGILAAVRQADVLVISSPIYFGEISGQLKCFFDRTYSFLNPDFTSRLAPAGRKVVLILTQGDPDLTHYTDVAPRYVEWLHTYGFERDWLIRGAELNDRREAQQRDDLLARADEVAAEVFG